MSQPKVYLLATTKLTDGWHEFLKDLGYWAWVGGGGIVSDGDMLCETAGRLCYRSWAVAKEGEDSLELNKNITKVREGNKEYLANVINSGHGSILEHVNFTFLFRHISRVFTHELVRHRAGCAYSQESLRYCKLENLEIVIPKDALPASILSQKASDALELMDAQVESARKTVCQLNKLLLTDDISFTDKKKITSFIRRIAILGVKTNIIMTVNARALRHILAQRTSIHAEAEIRQVFLRVGMLAREETPNLFQDMELTSTNEFVFKKDKI